MIRSQGESNAEYIQSLVPQADVVKAFNTIGAEVMAAASDFKNPPAFMIAGGSLHTRSKIAILARRVDFRPLDLGNLAKARYLEAVAMLWISLGERIDAEKICIWCGIP